jgi:hypothetical protein
MTQVQPAVPDRQSHDNPILAEERPLLAIEAELAAAFAGEPIFDLWQQVQTSGVIRRPDRVCCAGPANWLLTVRITRRRHGQSDDVTQRPYKLTSAAELLPAEWFAPGDWVQVERTQPFEPRPAVAAADHRPGRLPASQGVGDFISRRRR